MSGWINKHYNDALEVILQSIQDTHKGCNFPIPVGEYTLRKADKVRITDLKRWTDIRTSMQQLKIFQYRLVAVGHCKTSRDETSLVPWLLFSAYT
jgi:hypothetical protein